MLFGNRPTSTPRQNGVAPVKGRSILNVMFNPQIGATIRPLGQCADLFVQVIAMIFAMNGLFPKNHPVLNHSPYDNTPAPKLKLGDIFSVAWSGLEFTADGAPKVALFFAVVLCMALLALGGFLAAAMALFGTAHAATTGCSGNMFTPCNTSNDLAYNWLNFIFFHDKSVASDMATQAPGISGTHAWQDAFMKVLAFYSDAILVVAAFILFYHLVSMVVETAHHGVPMGKRASQIWAPIRLVVAIGLLVPISSSGLNSGQFIVIQIAEWGSGLGSQAWSLFVSNVTNNSVAPPPEPYVGQQAERIVMIAACVYTFNHFVTATQQQMSSVDTSQSMIQAFPVTFAGNTGSKISYNDKPTDNSIRNQDICGSVTLPGTPLASSANGTGTTESASQKIGDALISGNPGVQGAFETAYKAAYDKAYSEAGSAINSYFVDANAAGKATNSPDIIGDTATAFQSTLDTQLQSTMAAVTSQQATMKDNWTQWGWASAGTYFNDIAAVQSVVTNILKGAQPTAVDPAILTHPENFPAAAAIITPTLPVLARLKKWAEGNHRDAITQTNGASTMPAPPPLDPNAKTCAGLPLVTMSSVEDAIKEQWDQLKEHHQGKPVDVVLNAIDLVASKNCVWKPYNNGSGPLLAIQFTTSNPLAEMTQLGQNNLLVAFDLLNFFLEIEAGETVLDVINPIAGKFGLAGKIAEKGGQAAEAFLGLVATLVSFLSLLFFLCGVTLAFFVPLIPFTKFFFNMLSWIIMVMEAVVAIPLVALAHLNPEGEGLPGASAKTAYFFVFDIFLRPVLMIFGLICGYLIFLAAVAFLNTLYATAVVGTGGLNHGHIVFSRMFFSMLYVMLLYTAANNAFSLVHSFPEHALLWMGQRSMHKETMGDARDLAGHVSVISGYAGQQALSQAQGALSGFQGKLGRLASPTPPGTPRGPLPSGGTGTGPTGTTTPTTTTPHTGPVGGGGLGPAGGSRGGNTRGGTGP